MPELKQPTSLVNLTVERLATFFAHHYLALAVKEASDDLRRDVESIKDYVVSHVPRHLYIRLQVSVLGIIMNTEASETHKRTIVRVIMIARLLGFPGDFLCYPDPCEPHRITEVTALVESECAIHHNIQLNDLTNLLIFTMHQTCTDANLELISQNCSKLEQIDFSYSKNVTDGGLQALSRCSKLRYVTYTGCPISIQGIDYLFSANGEIRAMKAWSNMQGLDVSDPAIHPAIQWLKICKDGTDISNRYLNSVVRKFPNLTTLIIHATGISGNVCALSELSNLTCFELFSNSSVDWINLRSLFRAVGSKIEDLTVPITDQSDVNSVYEHCENVTALTFSYYVANLNVNRIVIPTFRNLTKLKCQNRLEYGQGVCEIGAMPLLKELFIRGFRMGSDIESLIVDHERFPNLRHLTIERKSNSNAIERLKQIAKTNNLDLTVYEFT